MRFTIKVKTNAKANAVEKDAAGTLRVRVKAPPQEGRANEAVIETLAAHFKVPKSRIAIVGGFKSKIKIVTIGTRDSIKREAKTSPKSRKNSLGFLFHKKEGFVFSKFS